MLYVTNASYTSTPLVSSQLRGVSSHELQTSEIIYKSGEKDKALKAEDTLRDGQRGRNDGRGGRAAGRRPTTHWNSLEMELAKGIAFRESRGGRS